MVGEGVGPEGSSVGGIEGSSVGSVDANGSVVGFVGCSVGDSVGPVDIALGSIVGGPV